MPAVISLLYSECTIIKALESIGISTDDLMSSANGSLELEIGPLNKEEVSVRVCKAQSS